MTPEQEAAIPAELKALRQWVWFEIIPSDDPHKKAQKVPRSAVEGLFMASPTNPATWASWEEVRELPNPAFCFRDSDPYVFLDMDKIVREKDETDVEFEARKKAEQALFKQVCETFPSYTERSTNGGLHVIGKGLVGAAATTPLLQIYDRARFCIFTGTPFPGRDQIVDFDVPALDKVVSSMRRAASTVKVESLPQSAEDLVVVAKIKATARGAILLGGGDHASIGKNPSELDHELIAMLTEESGNFDQVVRIFQASPLARGKSTEKYIGYSFQRVRGRIEDDKAWAAAFRSSIPQVEPEIVVPVKPPPQLNGSSHKPMKSKLDPRCRPTSLGENDKGALLISTLPEGMIKDLVFEFYQSSLYPLAEVSLLAGLNLFGLAVMRAFQGHAGAALNLFTILLAKSSSGKGTMTDRIPQVLGLCGAKFADDHWIGEVKSEAALGKALLKSNRFCMMRTECGSWIRAMTAEDSAPHERAAASAFTQLWSQGAGIFIPTRAASQDDKELVAVPRPCVSIIGETQPGIFWSNIRSAGNVKGFLPRFLILEVPTGSIQRELPPGRHTPTLSGSIGATLKPLLFEMAKRDKNEGSGTFQTVPLSDVSHELFRNFSNAQRKLMLDADDMDPESSLRGKMGENAIRIATLLAVASDWRKTDIVVEQEHMIWAMQFVSHCTENAVSQMSDQGGEVTVAERRRVVTKWITTIRDISSKDREHGTYRKYFKGKSLIDDRRLIPISFLRNRCEGTKAFKDIKNSDEFDKILKTLLLDGEIERILPRELMESEFGVHVPCVVVK